MNRSKNKGSSGNDFLTGVSVTFAIIALCVAIWGWVFTNSRSDRDIQILDCQGVLQEYQGRFPWRLTEYGWRGYPNETNTRSYAPKPGETCTSKTILFKT